MRIFTPEEYKLVSARLDKSIPYEEGMRALVPIVIKHEGVPCVFGTGTLLRIADDSFLVTAAHVLAQAKAQPLALIPINTRQIIQVRGDIIQHASELPDVAIVHLKPEYAETIDSWRWLRLSSISAFENVENALFTIFGFPASLSTFNQGAMKITTFFHMAPMCDEIPTFLGDYDPRLHVLIDMDFARTRGTDGTIADLRTASGDRLTCSKQDLGGLSGGSVWRNINSLHGVPQDSSSARLVAVITDVYSSCDCVRATWWKAVIDLIYKNFHDLHPAIEMWRGSHPPVK